MKIQLVSHTIIFPSLVKVDALCLCRTLNSSPPFEVAKQELKS